MFLDSEEHDLTKFVKGLSRLPVAGGGSSDIYLGELCEQPKCPSWWKSFLVRRSSDHTQFVAVKRLRNTQHLNPQSRAKAKKLLQQAVEIWHNLDHFNVLPLLGYMYIEGSHLTSFPSLVSPWCDCGTLSNYIQNKFPSLGDRISLMLQVISAISYLHSNDPPIVHGDLKPDNFFLQSNYQVRLSDFDLVKIATDGTQLSNTGEGTSRFMSPEFFMGQDGTPMRSLASDIWALGWTFYLILTGLYPYPDVDFKKPTWMKLVAQQIKCGALPNIPRVMSTDGLSKMQATIWPIMKKCWELDPQARPSADWVMQELREVILLNHSHHFDGPMFNFTSPEESRPSVIGDEDPYILEVQGQREQLIAQARSTLVASALQYLCDMNHTSASSVEAELGWKLLADGDFPAAKVYLRAAQASLDAKHPLRMRCERGLAQVARYGSENFDEAIDCYKSALAVCRVQSEHYPEQEYTLVREMVTTMFEDPRNLESVREQDTRRRARQIFMEALSFFMARDDLEYQAQVRCDLVQLELDGGIDEAAHMHARAAFQCAKETGQQDLAEQTFEYLLSMNALSEAQLNALDAELQHMSNTGNESPKLEPELNYDPDRTPDHSSMESSWADPLMLQRTFSNFDE